MPERTNLMKKWCALILMLLICTSATVGFAYGSKTAVFTLPSGKKSVTYVTFYASEPLELKPVIAHNKVGMTQELAGMARSNQAIAAINGTFFNPYDPADLQPMGGIAIHGEFVHARGGAVAMGITAENKLTFAPASQIKIIGGINGSRQWPHTWYAWFINHLPTSQNEIVIFTPRFRSSALQLPGFTLVVVEQGRVSQIVKEKASIPPKGFVIAYGSNTRDAEKFRVGDLVEYRVELPEPLKQAIHIIGVGPKLVTNGQLDGHGGRSSSVETIVRGEICDKTEKFLLGKKIKDGQIR
jgi:hypothetical protein